jgi:hypothetical protein
MNRLVAILMAVFACAVAALPAGARPTPDGATTPDTIKYCPTGPYAVNVSLPIANDADAGVLGNAWAFESYVRKLTVVRVGTNLWCAFTSDSGNFTTNLGPSPGGTGVLLAPISGTFLGSYRTTIFSAKFAPVAATTGTLPTADYECTTTLVCPGYVDWVNLYFRNVIGFGIARWTWQYNTSSNGTWYTQSTYPSYSDIRP